MRAAARILAILLIVIGAAAAIALWRIVTAIPDPGLSPALAQRRPDPAHGRMVALLGDCKGCHTTAEGDAYAGGVAFTLPVGTLYSSNITPDPATGIGTYDFTDFVRLMRFGVAPGGRRIYPAMPYPAYAKMSDEDLQDLFAYLKQQVTPVARPTRPAEISWPLTWRWPLALWNLAFHDPSRFVPDKNHDAEWNRGAYLVQGLAHCGTCHTPRNFAYAERDTDGATPLYLSGTSFAGTAPINLRGNDGDGLGRWSEADIVLLLKTGRNSHSAASGSMDDVVGLSTQYWDDADLAAVAAYLKSLSPAPGQHADFTPDQSTLKAYLDGSAAGSTGARLYMDSCSACHHLDGQGAATAFPALAGNPMVQSRDPSSLIEVILAGSRLPSTAAAPSPMAMPGFAWRYGDTDVAALASFVRSAWGNHAGPVAPGQVTDVRDRLGLH
jgi:mono/diheme cytochrome c family protein